MQDINMDDFSPRLEDIDSFRQVVCSSQCNDATRQASDEGGFDLPPRKRQKTSGSQSDKEISNVSIEENFMDLGDPPGTNELSVNDISVTRFGPGNFNSQEFIDRMCFGAVRLPRYRMNFNIEVTLKFTDLNTARLIYQSAITLNSARSWSA
jgi:hypothetical protein